MGFNSKFEAWATKSLPVPDSWRVAGGEKEMGVEGAGTTKEMETNLAADGTMEVKLTPHLEEKEFKEEDFKDPLRKPLMLDDGKWAVFCWYVMLPLTVITVFTVPDCRNYKR